MIADSKPIPLFDSQGQPQKTPMEKAQSIEGRAQSQQGFVSGVIAYSSRSLSIMWKIDDSMFGHLTDLHIETVAIIRGTSEDNTWGIEHATWRAVQLPASLLPRLRTALVAVAQQFDQGAITFTYGITELVS